MACPAVRADSVPELRPPPNLNRAFLSTLSDEALLLEFKTGVDLAFDVLYLRYQARILTYLRGMLSDSSMAEEVYNGTMFRVYSRLVTFPHPSQFRSYLYKAAYHSCLNANRRETNLRRRPPRGQSWGGTSMAAFETVDPEERLSSHQMLEITRSYMETLPAERRSALLMFHNDGMSYQEIANVLERPIGTVRWLIHEARSAMARHLETHLKIPG